MSDNTLRYIIAATIFILLLFQLGSFISGAFGWVWGLVTALVISAVSFFSGHMARRSGRVSAWYLLPPLLFTVVPILWLLWRGLTSEPDTFDRLLGLSSFLIGFVLPIALLGIVYYQLNRRRRH